MNSIRIIAEIEIKPEYRDDLLPVLQKLVAGSCAEAGNNSYEMTESIEKKGLFFVIENWKSKQAIAEHNETPHFRAFKDAIEGKALKVNITKTKKLY